MSKSKINIDDLLFKPLIVSSDEQQRVIIIYSLDVRSSKAISSKGKLIITNVTSIDILDITSSVKTGMLIRDNWLVSDQKKLKECFLFPKIEDVSDQLLVVSSLIETELNETSLKIQDLAKALTSVKFILGSQEQDTNSLIIGTETDSLAHIVFKTVTGDTAELSREQIEKIGSVVMDVMMTNASKDLDDQETVRKLRAEIDYKIIEALPDNMKTYDIHINMDSFINEVKKFQGGTEGI